MKFLHRIRAGRVVTLLAGAAIGFAVVGTASAASGSPASTTIHYYTLAASAFAPDSLDGATSDYYNAWDPSTLSNQDGSRCFDAGLSLPNGAVLSSVTFYYTNGATDGMYGELNRQNMGLHTSHTLASFRSTPTGGTPVFTHTSVAVTSYQTVNTQYGYSIGVCPFGDATFTGVTISYT